MRFKAKNSAIREQIASIRTDQITGTTSDFKTGVINKKKASQKVKTHEILTARALFVICTRLTVHPAREN